MKRCWSERLIRQWRALLLMMLTVVTSSAVAAADSASVESLAEQAGSVALVSVTRAQPLINQALTLPGMLAVEAYAYQVSVERLWKGVEPSELQVSLRSCTSLLKAGERYLVFGQWGVNGEWQVDRCQQILPELSAAEPMALLDRLYGHKVAQY